MSDCVDTFLRPEATARRQGLAGRALFAAILCLAFGSAQAALFEDDEARKAILELRQRVESVRTGMEAQLSEQLRKSAEDNAQLRRSLVDLQNQIETSRADVARLRGQGEQLQRELADSQRRQAELLQGLDERLRRFEPVRVTVDGKEFSVEPAERKEFEAALALFKKGEFAASQPSFVDFIKRYPQSDYRASALFWLGNAQYATRDYKEAVINFRALLIQAPQHMRVPETMLSIANCQLELKDPRAARKTFEELVKAYPQSEAAAAAMERLARLK
jgi:tol-pal system protein YbgF